MFAQTRQALPYSLAQITPEPKPEPEESDGEQEPMLAQTTESACDRDPMSWECSMEYLYGPDGLFSLAQIEAEEYDLAWPWSPSL